MSSAQNLFSEMDHQWMAQALQLAEQGLYTTTPNPRVGCVIVKNGLVIGSGAHLKAGEPHAEVHALRQAHQNARDQVKGADVYVTLEPCSHHGRTPPCADALIEAGVKRVIVAMQDPNPKVAGSGLARLQAHGIEVASGLMEGQARELNVGFISRMTRQLPYVRTKVAASLDGRTALANGESKWITGEPARRDVQHWRARSCAILTGIGTVLADDPHMDVRTIEIGRQPLRVIVDSQLRISANAKILQGNALVVYANAAQAKIDVLQAAGLKLIQLTDASGKVCLKSLLSHLAELGINELMVEAGQTLNGALMKHKLVDELVLYYAPVLLGNQARGIFELPTFTDMKQRIGLEVKDTRQFGADIRIIAKPIYSSE
ncbi:bifunctional diaminohydroxyphosphoribosylaminopyrimidine deaminase/5-amino-6-(5-phosphoribosylamino)uracil reductase RibD [Methyloradius palustris]|uniref:Riboflavin biosynthesis protein RibD n=1 Tax=Methyloradius palustris TaxID=2778876 RepID=A0A8D5JM17_9PROT|nr:bifunctional diaminohydroxyphosphoribosylaminopyrimidine deaminase/5-amino-6-(5-phosphoribosylamino)uracil reductase RibD [Methyloradius palustris]BCM25405.1 riboflavin biosynthesis protein RibD [Methyloradius palustris]